MNPPTGVAPPLDATSYIDGSFSVGRHTNNSILRKKKQNQATGRHGIYWLFELNEMNPNNLYCLDNSILHI